MIAQEYNKTSSCKSQHETSQICLFILVALSTYKVALQAKVVGNTLIRIIMPERPVSFGIYNNTKTI
jgi:hypothetical protein